MFYKRFEERFALEKDADGSGAQLPGPEAVRQLHADQRISCCTSVAAVQPPVVRRTGGFLKKRMTAIYVDKRVAGSNSDFEVDLGESLHLQSDARLAVCKIRLAGRVHWRTVGRLDQLQLCHRHYSKTTNSLSVFGRLHLIIRGQDITRTTKTTREAGRRCRPGRSGGSCNRAPENHEVPVV